MTLDDFGSDQKLVLSFFYTQGLFILNWTKQTKLYRYTRTRKCILFERQPILEEIITKNFTAERH